MKKRYFSLDKKKNIAGILFVLPWIIGFCGLFLRPLISSFLYSICDTKITTQGMQMSFRGFTEYYNALFTDKSFVPYLTEQITGMTGHVVVVIAFSLFMAVILNGKFKGRTFVRTIFFIPVIAGNGIVISIMNGDAMSNAIISGERASMLFKTQGIDTLLLNAGLSSELVEKFTGVVDGIFSLTWQSGLQILLFMTGLLSVSPSLYESARIEGATAWDSFWKITFPMISPILVLNIIYTLIDGFTDYSNKVIQYIYGFAQSLDFSYSSALSWLYFLVIMVLVGIVYAIINKMAVYTVE